jgi:methyl-accepting chemotaxis protein
MRSVRTSSEAVTGAIRDVAAKSDEIGTIVQTITGIAEDSQHAASEISELITAMQHETTRVVEVVEDGARQTQDGAAVVARTRESFLRSDRRSRT